MCVCVCVLALVNCRSQNARRALFNGTCKKRNFSIARVQLSDPPLYMAPHANARVREFHPLEALTLARAAPCHGGQPESPAAR
jgi:hypothetical protein